ncbi:NAD(+)/NADH kinase [Candidatus Bathyarchaeota archaeon]|nr:NAD(+)/NADH kinase [Candidatus Bathyarchaeota archaeon]
MKIGVVAKYDVSTDLQDVNHVLKTLNEYNVNVTLEAELAKIMNMAGSEIREMEVDLILCIGGDSTILKTIQELGEKQVPVLGVRSHGNLGFITEMDIDDFKAGLKRVLQRKYEVERRSRLECWINGNRTLPLALNEVAIFARTSATLIRYSLAINNKSMWRDEGDGVIVATPTGSTAYAMSAGGPVVLHNAPVFIIAPVNSVNPLRRPLIVPDKSEILVDNISSPTTCEVIVDGRFRKAINGNKVLIKRAASEALFVKLAKEKFFSLSRKLSQKTGVYEDLLDGVPPSAKLILKILQYEGSLTQKEIIEKTDLPPRTVRFALNLLMEKDIILKKVLLRDARQSTYVLNEKLTLLS